MTDGQKPLRLSGIVTQDTGAGLALSRTESKAVHVLNPTAKFIWGLCDGEHTVQSIEQAVRANFALCDTRDVMADVQRTLQKLVDQGLIRII
jgi:hypothetical protein